ncbi:hypothetical protein CK203_058861 [Vitis vinifera]|uniref:Uncharacterized protein n=1 Tax=Vitis vinifera TaxID=29760 RepID=A0A438G8X5_VITVI|nr:hypothetical protein CK203_058861 [Vitis vinifera]
MDNVILNTQGVLDSAVVSAKRHPDRVSVGALSSYEWLSETMVGDAAVRDRGKRLCRMIVGSDLLSLPLVFSFCRRFISGWLMLIIRMCCGDYPDVYALPASFALPWIGEAETSSFVPVFLYREFFCLLLVTLYRDNNRSSSSELYLIWFCFVVRNGSKKDCFVCPGQRGWRKGDRQINAKEFRERFRIPHDVLIDLVNEEAAMPTEKGGKTYPLHKGTIQRGAPVPSAGVVQGIPPLLSDSTHLHSSQPCPGADGMQHHQHAVQPRPYATGSVLCLFPEESKE